jgi:FMN phosphatase YigB (HAD superfamily)
MTVTVTRDVPPVTTLLFDLDGTLLDIDMPAFLKAYISLACRRFVSPTDLPRLTPALAAAAQKMGAYRAGTHTLDRVFLEAFSPAVRRPPIEVRGVFTAFHRAEFEQLRHLTAPRPAARPLLEKALALGYELAIATNPVFFLDAIRARIRWAGLDGFPFSLVTCAEIMRCAKPHRHFFTQTLRLLGRRPDECLMIGDDPRMDLPAGELGIGTWLVIPEPEECLAVAGADLRGSLDELAGWLDARGAVPSGRRPAPAPETSPAGSQPPSPLSSLAALELMREIDAVFATDEWAPPARVSTLRSLLQAGRMKPRHSVWLWIRIMRALAELHGAHIVFGCISPDFIFIDGETRVRIDKPASCRDEYVAPELLAGCPPSRQADIYSMGVVLFEQLTGTLQFVGQKRPAEVHADIPPWLDKLIVRCMEPDLKKRFRTIEEVSAALMKLKGAGPG